MIYRTLLITAAWAVAVAVGTAAAQFGTLYDSRDKQIYWTVTIGKQIWMTRNLNYRTLRGSWCYENKAENCKQYGRLYNWKTAKTVCPVGWKLPDTADWRELVTTAGGEKIAGKKLKSKSGWHWDDLKDVSGNGTDDYGFSALPGGEYDLSDGSFDFDGWQGYWWTATENDADDAYYLNVGYYNGKVVEDDDNKRNGHSVRCVAAWSGVR